MSFLQEVQANRVRGPQQKGFNRAAWDDKYASANDGSAADARLHSAGIWFADRLANARIAWSQLPRLNQDAPSIARALVGHANFLTVGSRRDLDELVISTPAPEREGLYPKMFDRMSRTAENIQHLIESLRVPLSNALAGIETSGTPAVDDSNNRGFIDGIHRRSLLGQQYDGLERLWNECQWNAWNVSEESGTHVIVPADLQYEVWRSVGYHRRSALLTEFSHRAIPLWRGLPREQRGRLIGAPVVVSVKRHAKRLKLQLGARDLSAARPPSAWVAYLLANDQYLDGIVEEPLPNFNQVSARDLLRAYYVLEPLSKLLATEAQALSEASTMDDLLACAPRLHEDEIVSVLSSALDIDRSHAKSVLSAITFDGTSRDEPWLKPFVNLGGGWLTVILEALRTPNLSWAIDNWLRVGGFDMASRGPAFEQHVRAELQEHASNLGMRVIPSAVRFAVGDKIEEIDIVVRLGSTLLIGEAKCSVFPTDPYQVRSYADTLEEGGRQAERKAAFVYANIDAFLSDTGLESLGVPVDRVLPFVVSNLSLGAALPHCPVPVVDMMILGRYFDEGRIGRSATLNPDGSFTTLAEEIFYATPAEAESKIAAYLESPPQLAPLNQCTRPSARPIVQFEGESPALYVVVRTELQEILREMLDAVAG